MQSSSGAHFVGLDHVRAIAALMVVAWHFVHGASGYPVPFEGAPAVFVLALLDEGHTGVALFMALSGYLFARLLEGKAVHFPRFLLNRLLRLAPLLAFVMAVVGLQVAWSGGSVPAYLATLARGFWAPAWPNGGWSIAVEWHFYVLLPGLLWLGARSPWWLVGLLLGALLLRTALWHSNGEVQHLAYFTIIGRLDQFLLGMLACHWRKACMHRHVLIPGILLVFTLFYWWFAHTGGFYLRPSYPSPSPLWIAMPMIEGGAYALAIAWYDTSFRHGRAGVSGWIARAGVYSYSVYLLHFFFVFEAADFIHTHVMPIGNFYVACAWALLFYCLMLVPAHLSYRFIEAPFLAWRKPYLKPEKV